MKLYIQTRQAQLFVVDSWDAAYQRLRYSIQMLQRVLCNDGHCNMTFFSCEDDSRSAVASHEECYEV